LNVKRKIKRPEVAGVISKSKGGPNIIKDSCWINNDDAVTCGIKNYKLWTAEKLYKTPRNSIKRGFDNKLLCC